MTAPVTLQIYLLKTSCWIFVRQRFFFFFSPLLVILQISVYHGGFWPFSSWLPIPLFSLLSFPIFSPFFFVRKRVFFYLSFIPQILKKTRNEMKLNKWIIPRFLTLLSSWFKSWHSSPILPPPVFHFPTKSPPPTPNPISSWPECRCSFYLFGDKYTLLVEYYTSWLEKLF